MFNTRTPVTYALLAVCAMMLCSRTPLGKQELRIVSLSPAMTEILYALGANSNIVGCTAFCDYPEEAQRIYRVGDFSNPSLERIIGLKPDLVIVNLPEQARIKKQLDDLKIKVFVSSPKSLDGMYQEIASLGMLLKKERVADSLISYVRMHIRPQEGSTKRTFIELAPRPIITVGSQSYLNELIEMAGGTNIFSDITKDYPVVSQEEVIRRDPEVIILLHPEALGARMGWEHVTAVAQKKAYTVPDPDILMRPGPRLVQGFAWLEKILHE